MFSFSSLSHRGVLLIISLLLGVSSLLPCSAAYASISKDNALNRALHFVDVQRNEIEELKIQRDREKDIEVYKIEFSTEYGDFDFAYAQLNGRLIDADYEIDEEYLRTLPRHNLNTDQAVNYIARKLNVPLQTIKARREGNRLEARIYHNHMLYEIELDCRSGVIYDFNADLRERLY